MLGVVDYGVGNLFSLSASLEYLGVDSVISGEASVLEACDRLILPGVGAFGDAAARLRDTNLDKTVISAAENGVPVLGICLGMQLLFKESFEYGRHRGLGLLDGEVLPLAENPLACGLKIPHIGWNRLKVKRDCPLTGPDGEYVYYVHSYYADGGLGFCAASSEYGAEIAGLVFDGNVFGTQFHPEKSGNAGLRILKAFSEIKGGTVC